MLQAVKQFGLYGILFFFIIFLFGIINGKKTFDFWIYDKADYNEWTVDCGNKGETDYATNFIGKMRFVDYNGLMRNFLNQHEMNGVVKLNNGYLLKPMYQSTNEELEQKADSLLHLKEYLSTKEIPLLFALAPYTSSKYDSQLPLGMEDYGNENDDKFMDMLLERDIDTIDFRETMYNDGINQYSMMYKTDHHWTTNAGFYAYTYIADYLENKLNCTIDNQVKDIRNYNITTYKKWHLGSNGQRTGKYYAGIDDFNLIEPNFSIQLEKEGVEGDFSSLIINKDALTARDYSSRYTYVFVLNGALANYSNKNAWNDKKILMVTDSMGKCVNPYMILSFQNVETIQNIYSEQLSKEYIEEHKPDAVVLLYYSIFLCPDSGGFNFKVSED